jgi:branched-chain amino acid transport system substrate-binding protein
MSNLLRSFQVASRLVVVAAIGAMVASSLGLPTATAQADEVEVALIAPLSGPWARQGELMRMGGEMAVDEINEQGGIAALGGAKLRLIIADAGDNAEKAKNAAQRVLAQHPDLVGGTGSWLSSFTLAVTEVTERAELPFLTLSYSDKITDRGFRYVFQTSPTGGTQSTQALPTILALGEKATGKRPQRVGILMDNSAAPVSFSRAMREGGFDKLGLELVMDEIFTPPLSDATALVQRVRSSRPDFLLMLASNIPDDKLILEKLNEFGMGKGRLPLVANGAHIGAPDLVKNVGADLLEGLMFIVANWGQKGQEQLIKRFTARTGEPWITQDSITTYGDMWIFKEALERTGKADRVKVAEEIRKMDLNEGPAGIAYPGAVRFEPNGRRSGAPIVIVQWQDGVPVSIYPPEVAMAEPKWPKQ